MKNKIKILLEDDNEVLGNGLGHPCLRQYLPTKRYVNLLNKYNIKGTFYIDMAHYLFLKKNETISDFKYQLETIEQTIKLLAENGMDIQIHLHSQWLGASIEDGNVFVTDKWNIGLLKPEEQKLLFVDAHKALFKILSAMGSKQNLTSYKAGSWGIQPFKTLYDVFNNHGIKLVLGPIKGLKIDKLNIDYSNLNSDHIPYYASRRDINKVDDKKNIVVLPMTPTYLNWFDLIRYILEIKISNYFKNNERTDISKIPESIKRMKPLSGKDKLNFGFRPFRTHLKINAQKFWFLRNTFKRSYKKIKSSNCDYKLMVIETHTKDFLSNHRDIEMFFDYIKKNYSDVEFVTASNIVEDIKSNKLVPLDG